MVKKDSKRRPGRPPAVKGQRRDEAVKIAVTAMEKKKIEQAATAAGLSLSDYGRKLLLENE